MLINITNLNFRCHRNIFRGLLYLSEQANSLNKDTPNTSYLECSDLILESQVQVSDP